MNIPPIKEVIQMGRFSEFWSVLMSLAMVICGALALYICFGGTFAKLLSALPF